MAYNQANTEGPAQANHETTIEKVTHSSNSIETDSSPTDLELLGSVCSRVDSKLGLDASRPTTPVDGESTSPIGLGQSWKSVSLEENELHMHRNTQVLAYIDRDHGASLKEEVASIGTDRIDSASAKLESPVGTGNLSENVVSRIDPATKNAAAVDSKTEPIMLRRTPCSRDVSQDLARTSESQLQIPNQYEQHRRRRIRQKRYMYVSLRTQLGHSYRLRVREADTVERIKYKVYSNTGIPIDRQHLVLDGKELKNDMRTALQHGIRKGCSITLIVKVHSGNVRMEYIRPECLSPEHNDAPVITQLRMADGRVEMIPPETDPADLQSYVRKLVNEGQQVSTQIQVGGKSILVCLRPPSTEIEGSMLSIVKPVITAQDTESVSSIDRIGLITNATEQENRDKLSEDGATRSKMEELKARMALQKKEKLQRQAKKIGGVRKPTRK